MSCLAMIGEGTGVALNYAMTRSFPTFDLPTGEGVKEYHLIYDSGALSTTATVVAFYQTSILPTPKAKTPINTTHIEVLGTGWEEVGGVMLDLTIQEMLVEDFVEKSGKSGVREDKRAMAKLAREATRVKQILSANQESNVGVCGLLSVSVNTCSWKNRWNRCTMMLTTGLDYPERNSKKRSNFHYPSFLRPSTPLFDPQTSLPLT